MHRKTSAKKLKIIKTALEIFNQHGIENTTIEMIRVATETSVGSLYHHFGNKEGLAAAVYMTGLQDFSERLFHAVKQCKTLKEAVYCIVESNIDWIEEQSVWAKFIFEQHNVLKAAGEEQYFRESATQLQQALNKFIVGLDNDVPLQDYPPEILSSLLVGPTHDYARHWLNGRRSIPLQQLKGPFALAAWQGLLNLNATGKN